MASIDEQACAVRLLDRVAQDQSLTVREIEAAAALAISLQHGMRPIQIRCVELGHVQLLTDAAGDLTCLISFHGAKRSDSPEMLRQIKPEWAPLIARLYAEAKARNRVRLFSPDSNENRWSQIIGLGKRHGLPQAKGAYRLRRASVQALADAGHDRHSIQRFLGHINVDTAQAYVSASIHQGRMINKALGVSRIYKHILDLAHARFVSLADLEAAEPDCQIGAIAGNRLIAGIGICNTGQSNCRFNPVTSCYGCDRFLPSLDEESHLDSIAGMREQVQSFLKMPGAEASTAYRQLMEALSAAQQTLDALRTINSKGGSHE